MGDLLSDMNMDYRIKYVKSLNKVINQLGDQMEMKDNSNLNMLLGHLFECIRQDGNMTIELARELGLGHLNKE